MKPKKEKPTLYCVCCGHKSKKVLCSDNCETEARLIEFVWPKPEQVKLSEHLACITGFKRMKFGNGAIKQHKSTLKSRVKGEKTLKCGLEVVVGWGKN
jgi:hypothetical protein